jgi:acetylornithine deacetylase/succinyl-diaminopimelate desuccinylase-like protein
VAGYCDLRHYTSGAFMAPIPACLYGPGGGRSAHAEDEFFLIDHLGLVARNIGTAVLNWCGVE